VSTSDAVVTLGPLRAADRERVRPMVTGTGVFRMDEVDVAVEVFDDAVARPGVDYHGIGAHDDAGTFLGFAIWGHTPCTTATWDLYWIVVDRSAQRCGLGRRLMDAAERDIRSRDGRLVVVETSSRDDYGPTRKFYESIGYDRTARIAGYYAPQDDLIVYTKVLDPPETAAGHYG
jgi:ribosomal protein S18 acetylase RimI-like enzyme